MYSTGIKVIIGIDNGVTGGITVITDGNVFHMATPVKKELSYTKKKQWITRIDHENLRGMFEEFQHLQSCLCLIERPMVNPARFKATVSALRALESTIVVLESLRIPIEYIDSKEWQKAMLPKGLKGDELKKAAICVAKRLFPNIKIVNADSLLIALYGQKQFMGGSV